MRLIDAHDLSETLRYYIDEAGWGDEINKVLRWVINDFIPSERTIDAEPVRHGRWIPTTGLKHPDWFTCSECTGQFDKKWNYCPNCGAMMRTGGNRGRKAYENHF